jgi:hypothetical protein
MSSTNRHHTVIVNGNGHDGGIIELEKDWWNGQFAQGWQRRMVVDRPQGTFHIVGESFVFSPAEAGALIDRIIAGKTQTIDLREMSMKHYGKRGK